MSPVGLDVKEYAYAIFPYTVPDGEVHTLAPAPDGPGWDITRLQMFASPDAVASLTYFGQTIDFVAGGCVELLPGGAMRGPLVVTGEGAYLLVEYWYRASAPRGDAPVIQDNGV